MEVRYNISIYRASLFRIYLFNGISLVFLSKKGINFENGICIGV